MYSRALMASAILVGAAGLSSAQGQMRATYKGGGDGNQGKCTVDLVVDGAVDVEIRGDTAYLHNLSGQPARPRRFVCTGPVPQRLAEFRFSPQEGRGRQTLVRDPRNGGPIVVRIEDTDGGSEGYKFDFYWGVAAGPAYGGGEYGGQGSGRDNDSNAYPSDRGPGSYRDQDDYHRDRRGWQAEDWRQRIFERVRQDVEHVQPVFQSDDDRRRILRVIQELNEMQGKLARGNYDHDELDDVIESLDRVLRDNRLSQRDGQLLSDDLDRLREFRSRHSSTR